MNPRLIGLLGAMFALLMAALATGTRVYYLLLLIMLLMLFASALSVLWTLLTLKTGMKGVKSRVMRGEKLTVILTASHRALLPCGRVVFTLSLPGSSSGREISAVLPPVRAQSFRSAVHCSHRGSYKVGIASVSVEDAFGLLSLKRPTSDALWRIDVYPKSFPTAVLEPKTTENGGEYRSRTPEDNASPSDVRKWQDGDELKKVHWKLSLRKREIMVRTFEESARPDTLIIPDLTPITALNDRRLALEDRICESALSCAKAQLEAGYPVRMPLVALRPNEAAGTGITALPDFSEALMRATFDCPVPYEQVLMQLQNRAQRTGGIILITSKLSPRVADTAIRLQRTGMAVKLIFVSDAPRSEALEMLERMRMGGVKAERSDPWSDMNHTSSTITEDSDI